MKKSYLKDENYQKIRLKLFNNKFDMLMATKAKDQEKITTLEQEKKALTKELAAYFRTVCLKQEKNEGGKRK